MLAAAALWFAGSMADPAALQPALQSAQPSAPKAAPAELFAPAQLLATPLPLEARLGAALARALHGEFEAAADAVDQLAKGGAATGAPAELKARLEREQKRLVALAAARHELLEKCVQEQRKLHFKQGDKSFGGTVVEANADRIVLADAKGKRQEVPLAALDPEELLKRMGELKLETGSATTRAYAALLAGRKSWAKGLEATGDADAAALRSDATGCAALLATGAAAATLESLAAAPLPAAGPPVEATLAAIKGLLADHGREPIVVERRALLRKLAGAALATRFDARGIAGAGLKGEVAPLADGVVRLAYEFKSAAVLEDFAAADARHPSWSTFEIKLPKGQWRRTIDEESLVVVGEGCLRHRVAFTTPVRVDYEVEYAAPIKGMSTFSTLRVAVADDGDGTMVTNLDLTSIDAYQHGRRILDSSDPGSEAKPVATRIAYAVGLEYDGSAAKLKVTELPDQQIAAPPFQDGGVAIYWKSDAPVRITKFAIEGRVAPDGLAALREAAVGRDLTALFGD